MTSWARRSGGLAAVALAACYAPTPATGLPCGDGGACPTGQACTPSGTCQPAGGADAAGGVDGDPDAAAVANVAFVTADVFTALFSADGAPVAVADAACATRAAAAHLPGTFVALLRTLTFDPTSRLIGSRGWVNVAGVPIADQLADWGTGALINPIRLDENGNDLGRREVWLGFASGDNTCTDWTSTGTMGGVTFASDGGFVHWVDVCGISASLLCVETGHDVPVATTPTTGRFEFVTTGTWHPGGGLDSADTLCTNEASLASLPGRYRALLTTSAADGFSRFSDGLPWVRTDGVALTATASDLIGSTPAPLLATFPNRTASGGLPPGGSIMAWMGTSTENCLDWSEGTGAQVGHLGIPDSSERATFTQSIFNGACSDSRPLICLQE